jgi:hypothetical protein
MSAPLDLDDIRRLLEQPHGFHVRVAADRLLDEVERLRAEPFPTSEAYESMATAMGAYRALAEEMLGHWPARPRPDVVELRSEPVPVETVQRWGLVLGGDPR